MGGPWWGRGFYALALPLILKAIKRMYGISPEVGREDLARLGELFERVDAHLGSRRYLVGDSFTRADLTFAALAAPLLHPAGHPVQWPTSQLLPAQLAEEVAPFNTTRTADYVRRMYRDHRSKVRPVR